MKKHKVIIIVQVCIIAVLAVMMIMLYNNSRSYPDSKSENNIYDGFTQSELEKMAYSKLAWFSLTTDFDPSQYSNVNAGDEFTVKYKLTNMTDKELEVNIMAGQDSYEQVASLVNINNINPVATGDIHNYTFKPYETIVLTSNIKVKPDDLIQDGVYIMKSSVLVEVMNGDHSDLVENCYFSLSMQDMYLYAE